MRHNTHWLLLLALGLLLPIGAAQASEVTGTLNTGISGTVGNTLEGTVTTPPSGGGGGGGGGSSSSSSSHSSGGSKTGISTTTVTATTSLPTLVTVQTPTGTVLGAATYNFAMDLTLGSYGSDVKALQEILISEGYLAVTTPTSYFGMLTRAAVIKYQAAHGVSATGYVGPMTRAILNKGIASSTTQDPATLIANLMLQVQKLQAQLAALRSAQ